MGGAGKGFEYFVSVRLAGNVSKYEATDAPSHEAAGTSTTEDNPSVGDFKEEATCKQKVQRSFDAT